MLIGGPMAIAALVVQLQTETAGRAIARLSAHPALTLGARQGLLVPLTAESPDARSGAALFDELRDVPGVLLVHVVMVDTSDETSAPEETP